MCSSLLCFFNPGKCLGESRGARSSEVLMGQMILRSLEDLIGSGGCGKLHVTSLGVTAMGLGALETCL